MFCYCCFFSFQVAKQGEDPHKALNIDLDRPLDADEVLPVRQHRVVTGEKEDVEQKDGEAEGKTKERRKKKKDKEKERKVTIVMYLDGSRGSCT